MNQLAVEHKPLTNYIPQIEKLDEELYNSFLSNVYVDLNLLFLESLLIESATTNYERIFDGILSDLDREIKALRERVESLRLVGEGEDGIIVLKRSFESVTEMEDREKFASLFVDRDGTDIQDAVFERKHDEYFIALSKTKETDALRDNGIVTATIHIEDRRGVPIEGIEEYKLENAMDGDLEKYWAETVLADEPINSPMRKR